MVKKMWEDLFHSSEEGISIAPKEDIEEIIDMLIEDKIDPQIFLSNLEALLKGGIPSFIDFLGKEEKHKPTRQCQLFSVKSHQGFILNGFHSFNYAAIL